MSSRSNKATKGILEGRGGLKRGCEVGREFLKIRGGGGMYKEDKSRRVTWDQADQPSPQEGFHEGQRGVSRGGSQERGALKDQAEGSEGPWRALCVLGKTPQVLGGS